MTLQEMVELVQQHHPRMGINEIIKLLNRASDDFCSRTRILEDMATTTTVVDQRFYSLPSDALEVKSIDYDGKNIQRSISRPKVRDIT